ncbi:MAG: transglutaminase-like domain-containing protein, partial [Niameybacter sp.]
MLFTEKERIEVEKEFINAKDRFKGKEVEFFGDLEGCNEEERICLQHLYSLMPLSDIADYDGNLILKFVRASLKTRKELSWGEHIPTEIFMYYVLCYRVNNENIEDYREVFFEEIYPRVKNKSMTEAALEVNYWCLQKAVYKSTDSRTASPLTVIRNAYGRCGEESTLLVSALRSVGIPARQCYVPRWAHCDDNHAWVEVWADGKWHYMGACEPEPILDTGWFDLASSKAMLTEVKVFGKGGSEEEVMKQTAITSIINTLDHYAETKVLTVKVIDKDGMPIEGAKIRFELLNYSELYPIATRITDKEGKATFKTGFGDIMIHVVKESLFYVEKVDMRKQEKLIVEWVKARSKEEGTYDFDMIPPMIESIPEKTKSAEQNRKHEEKVREAHEIRKAYENTFHTEESAKSFAKDYVPYEKEVEDFLIKAKGNHQVITDYLIGYTDRPLKYKIGILGTLKLKDYTDISLECLIEHMKASLVYKENYKEEIFIKDILAPRIHIEMMSSYKQGILDYFTNEEIEKFREDPEQIIQYIKENISDSKDFDYPTLYATPMGTLATKKGSITAWHILFVAICRAIGIPAHIQKVDGSIEYYKEDGWVNRTLAILKEEMPINVKLTLKKEQPG